MQNAADNRFVINQSKIDAAFTIGEVIIAQNDLAPDIVEAILNGRQPKSLTLSQIDKIPLVWQQKRKQYGFAQAA